jgi:methyl-accepting chemotaxis protein
MSKFPRIRLKVAAKAIALIAGLGIMSALANWLCLQRLDRLDDINNAVVSQMAPARLALTEAKMAIASAGLAIYKMAATADPDTVREALEERDGQFAAAKAWLRGAVGYLPERADDVQGVIKRLDLVNDIANSVYALNKSGDRERARALLELKFDPALVDAATAMNRLINILGGESNIAMTAAAGDTARTFKLIMAVLLGGTVATVLAAMILAHRSMAPPLQRLAGVMGQIVEGEFAARIEGVERGR